MRRHRTGSLTARTLDGRTVTLGEPGRAHPRLERFLVTPAGDHQPLFTIVSRAQQLEPLEAVGAVHRASSRSKPMGELVAGPSGDGDGIDLDRGHASRLPRAPGPHLRGVQAPCGVTPYGPSQGSRLATGAARAASAMGATTTRDMPMCARRVAALHRPPACKPTPRACWTATESDPTPPSRSCWPPATTPNGSTAGHPSSRCAEPARSKRPPARHTVSGSTGAATGKRTRRPCTIAIAGLRRDTATQAYVNRRVTQGKTRREAIRCLKHYIAREMRREITRVHAANQLGEPQGASSSPSATPPPCTSPASTTGGDRHDRPYPPVRNHPRTPPQRA